MRIGLGQFPREWFFYSIAMFIAPLFCMTTTQPLVSMPRFVLVLFPLFCLLGEGGPERLGKPGFLAALC